MGVSKYIYCGPYVSVFPKKVIKKELYKVHPDTKVKMSNDLNFCPKTGIKLIQGFKNVEVWVNFNIWDWPQPLRPDFFFHPPYTANDQLTILIPQNEKYPVFSGLQLLELVDLNIEKELEEFQKESKFYLDFISSQDFKYSIHYGIVVYEV